MPEIDTSAAGVRYHAGLLRSPPDAGGIAGDAADLLEALLSRAEAAEASDAESLAMYRRARERAEAAERERDEIARLRAEVERLMGERDHWISRALHADIIAELLDDYADHLEADRAAFAQRVAEAVREACAERGHSLWYDAESECGPSHTSDGIRALDLGPIVAAALAKEGE
jgi:hypothetical protein